MRFWGALKESAENRKETICEYWNTISRQDRRMKEN